MAGQPSDARIIKLLQVLQSHAPTGVEQQQCSEILYIMQKNGLTNAKIEERLAGYLLDGLKYGNWPWI